MRYDLHIHSALSPCADRDMTPANIAGMAKLAGAELIAVADHNSALNLPAVQAACDAYGLGLLPAIEANTAEEVHLLCYLPTVEAALELGEIFYAHLPAYGYDPAIWGEQWVMDTDDNILRRVDKLLTGALTLLSVFGLWPEDLGFEMLELARPHAYPALAAAGRLPAGLPFVTSSDAHALVSMREEFPILAPECPLWRLLGEKFH